MVSVTKLLCDGNWFGDGLRYSQGASAAKNGVNSGRGPVVVWNCTRTCNLNCKHCYSNSENKKYEGELTTLEAKKFIRDLAEFNVPVLLISGGEPLLREDLLELIDFANLHKIRSTISTNGTMIDKAMAKKLKACQVGYVGISLDGIGAQHDAFRGQKGSFDKAIAGIRNCLEVEQKVGVRFTISKDTLHQLEDIFYLIKTEKIPRACFYHLVYSGRGKEIMEEDVSHEESRGAMELIMKYALELGETTEILTVDNHADGIYLYLKAVERYPQKAEKILDLLRTNGGNRSGIAIGNVDHRGFVHPDQFTPMHTFGNVKEESFGSIWSSSRNPILAGLKDRKALLKGRCGQCKWLEMCNGNFRARAEAVTDDFWESDPACYLRDDEIGL